MVEIINFPRQSDLEKDLEKDNSYVDNYALKTKKTMESSFNEIFPIMQCVMEQFSEQVTCVCIKTGKPLFDLERAIEFRRSLNDLFSSILETIDEEIAENQ